ncbi:hypothetical protein M1403_01400 [Patescibacteria group bacterium]|nr:hypothetical protein [Patescibacteria group bacterium]
MKHRLLAILFSLAVVLVMVTPLWRSGVVDNLGNILFDAGATYYDAGVHLSLIGEMQSRFPPTDFAYGGVPLKNYHYLYDTALAAAVKVTGISYLDLYYRFAPIILALLLSLVIYLTTLVLTKNPWAATFSIFFSVFATSLGVLTMRGTNNVFMTDQIYDMMINPQGVLSLIVFLSLFLLLAAYEKSGRKWQMLVFAILLAASFGIKAHGGVVFAIGAVFGAGWFWFKKKDIFAVLAILIGLGGMLTWVKLNLDGSAVGIQVAPFWLLERLMGDYERLYLISFTQHLETAKHFGNWLTLTRLYLEAFIIYLFGSLGLRIIGLLPLISALRNWQRTASSRAFLFFSGLASFAIPLFFNQGKKPFDIVQFTPYFTLFLGICFTVFVFAVLDRVNNKAVKVLTLLVLVAIFLGLDKRELLSRGVYLNYDRSEVRQTIDGPMRGNQVAITAQEVAAVNYIRAQTPTEAIFLVAPTKLNLGTLWFSALAWRRTVYSGEFFPFQVGLDTAAGKNHIIKEFGPEPVKADFGYVFLRRNEVPEFGRIKDKYQLHTVFENSEAVIYER